MIITMLGGFDAAESVPHLITHRSAINCAKLWRDWYANERIRRARCDIYFLYLYQDYAALHRSILNRELPLENVNPNHRI